MNKRSKTRIWIALIVLLGILAATFSDWIVEWLWLEQLGYSEVFWTVKSTQIILLASALVVALLYVLPNMRMIAKRFSALDFGQGPLAQLNLEQFSYGQVKTLFYSVGAIFSLFFSLAFYMRWDSFFRFQWSESFGKTDPVFGNDIGFYLFELPFIESIQNSLVTLVFFVTLVLLVFYLYSGALNLQESASGSKIQESVRRHLSINVGIWLLLLSWGYYLSRYRLLYDGTGLVYGAGYTDINVVLPTLWIMALLCLLLAGLAFFQMVKPSFRLLLVGGVATAVIGFLGQGILPGAVQKFMVEPNELELERPHLKDNIEETRQAYNLNAFKERDYAAGDTLSWEKIRDNISTLQNIRLWDPRLIIQTYRQLQEIRTYYHFFDVDMDRYHTSEGYMQMMISARELSSDLPEQADTWVNRHLQYTHGYGLVMSPVAQIGKQGDPRLVVRDLPPVTEMGLNVKRPGLYYGEYDPDYKIVNTDVKELDYPKGDENVYNSYDGKGGVSIDGFFEKLLFAWKFGDMNILLTDYIHEGSKIQFWKSIKNRATRIAPFLKFEDDPYLVLHDGKLQWIQDAYTTSSYYPYSERYEGRYNYIRNSVKVVVDAFDGTVEFYVADENDPILKVYSKIFPDMFKPLDQMPATLKSHLRYPKTYFKVQMDIYNTYHMTTPQVFYNSEDLWTRPNEQYGGRQIKMEPYYLLSKLPGEEKLQYLLISPLTPRNKDNMIAWITAKSDFPQYGQVEVFKLPKERLIYGPAQIEAKIDQDTEISRQLSLWDQRGSSVIRGNLMVVPIEDSFLYVEPVFLIAQGVDIPQLQRVIVTAGEKVVMEPTLDLALESLYGKRPEQRIMGRAPAPVQKAEGVARPQISRELERFRTLWKEAQQALQAGDWQTFGQKMKEIEQLAGNGGSQ